jgi:hypothetical protein
LVPIFAELEPIVEVGHRIRVVVALAVARTALHPEGEQDDDEDREGDEADQPQGG